MMQTTPENEENSEFQQWLSKFETQAPVISVPVFNACDDLVECIESLLSTTPPTIPILIVDDASTDQKIKEILTQYTKLFSDRLFAIHKSENQGFVLTCNLIFTITSRHDVVLVNSDIVLPAQWLDRLRQAAYKRDRTATATPLTNHGTIISVPFRNKPTGDLPNGETLQEIDNRVKKATLQLYPTLPTAIGHCTYFRRTVLDLVGFFDPIFSPGYGEEVDFSQRAIKQGFIHVLADDLFVYHKGSRSFESTESKVNKKKEMLKAAHEEVLRSRYPWYEKWVYELSHSSGHALANALEQANMAIRGCKIAVDMTYLSPTTTGTSVMALELVRALSTLSERSFHITLLVRDAESERHLSFLRSFVDEIACVQNFVQAEDPIFDLIFRPSQVFSKDELLFLRRSSRRVVLMILDFIAYANPSYFHNYSQWKEYQRLMRLSLDVADGIAWNSAAVQEDAEMYGLNVQGERSAVVYNGVVHQLHQTHVEPSTEIQLPARSFILMLGTDFLHKNRLFSMKLFRQLVEKYGWSEGKLVFAGPRATIGGSKSDETDCLEKMPEYAKNVVDLGPVSEAQKQWLLMNAALVLYPSICEGFGLIPFEAAMAGTPALTFRFTSLGEILGDKVMYLPSFDVDECAALARQMILEPQIAQQQIQEILNRSDQFQWNKVAEHVWQLCEHVLRLPEQRPDSVLALQSANDSKKLQARSWRQRVSRGFQILIQEGVSALMQESRQYITWTRRQRESREI